MVGSMMIQHEDTKLTKDTKKSGLMVSHAVIGAAIEVHRCLGPGLLESVYQSALSRELWLRGLNTKRHLPVELSYKGADLGTTLRLDLLVEGCVVVEVKSVAELAAVHRAQLLTYLKLTGYHVGLLINFNVLLLRRGIKRVLHG
jgi:GxxExxY protein